MANSLAALKRLHELSLKELEKAAKALKKANDSLRQAELQLNQLTQYRHEYSQRLNKESKNGFSSANYRNFQRFIGTLEYTIKEQNRRIEALSAQSLEMKQQWYACQQRCQAYETLIQRRHAQSLESARKIEQRTNDELATQAFLRSKHFS